MKKGNLFLFIAFVLFVFSLTACVPQSTLQIEEHPIKRMNTPVEGNREDILAKHQAERSISALSFSPPITLGSDTINVVENFSGKFASVDVFCNDELEISIDAGVISPINNYRGIWVVDEHWVMEVAHVEEDPADPNAAFIIWGEIFHDGESINEKYGYDEAFNFQILNGKPFFFFRKGGEIGFSYDEVETALEYTEIPHYMCCSASAFNPLAAENMVAFYASKGEQDYYVEIGAFE